jgi:hypothetical protein
MASLLSRGDAMSAVAGRISPCPVCIVYRVESVFETVSLKNRRNATLASVELHLVGGS